MALQGPGKNHFGSMVCKSFQRKMLPLHPPPCPMNTYVHQVLQAPRRKQTSISRCPVSGSPRAAQWWLLSSQDLEAQQLHQVVWRSSTKVRSCCCAKAVSANMPDKDSPSVLKDDIGQLVTQGPSVIGPVILPRQGLCSLQCRRPQMGLEESLCMKPFLNSDFK